MNFDLVDQKSMPEMADKHYFLVGDRRGWEIIAQLEERVDPSLFSVMLAPTPFGMLSLALVDKNGVSVDQLAGLLADVTETQITLPATIRFVSIAQEGDFSHLAALLNALSIPAAAPDLKDCALLFPAPEDGEF